MQTIAQNGYTQQEIVDVLQFKKGVRQTSFRYELLDLNNIKLQDLTNVLDCTVSADFTQDVKRTAKFTLQDDSSIDFTNDRIRPWAQVIMPDQSSLQYGDVQAEVNGIITGNYSFEETFASGGTLNAGAAGSGFNGTIGTGVSLAQAGIIKGSAFGYTGTDANSIVTIPNGMLFFNNHAGASGFTIVNEMSLVVWVNATVAATGIQQILSSAAGSSARLSVTLGANNGIVAFNSFDSNGNTIAVFAANPFGTALRMIGITRRTGGGVSIYLNGILQPTQITFDETNATLAPTGNLIVGAGVTGTIDALSFYSTQIPASQMLDFYRSGARTGPFGASNYAEWPQGTFILNSPTRAEDDNKVITRDIDGYDVDQVYIDDVVVTRFTVLSGTLYLNAVLGLVLNYTPTNLGIQDPTYWMNSGTVTYIPGTISETLAGPTTAGATTSFTKSAFSIANASFSCNTTLPASGNGNRSFTQQANSLGGFGASMSVTFSTGHWRVNCYSIANNTGTLLGTFTYPDNPALEITTRIRIWENQGQVYFQSATLIFNWVTHFSMPAWSYLDPTDFAISAGSTGTESAWNLVFNIVQLSAALLQNVNASPSTAFPTVAKDYDPGTTKLAIINDLLSTIAYNPLYFDEYAVPQLLPVLDPTTRPAEYTYAEDQASVTLPAKTDTFDLWGVPNVFVLVASNPDSTLYTTTYTNSNPASPTSTVSRGRSIVHYELESDATDLLTLQAKAKALALAASQVYDSIAFTTAIMPFHSINDVYAINFGDIGAVDKYNEIQWSFQLKDGATMSHTARKQVPV